MPRAVGGLLPVTGTVASALRVVRTTGAVLVLAALLLLPASAAAAEPAAPQQITFGAYINDIQDLDLQNHSYAVDVYVWLRWTDPSIDPSATLELMNPYELWTMVRTPAFDTPQLLPDGSLYQTVRFQGRFSSKMALEDFPFDQQTLTMVFEDDRYDDAEIAYVPDADPITMNELTSLPGYELGSPNLVVSTQKYPTTFGDTSMTEAADYSRVTISVPITRPSLIYVIKLIVPVLLVVIVAALVFLLHSSYVEARIAMGVTALLTLVALQFTTNATLPQVEYPMMIDLIYVASYLFVLAVMAQAVATSWMAHRGDATRAIALDRRMVVVAGIGYALLIAAILVAYLA